LPPFHIKLGLMKNSVKAMNKDGDGFLYLMNKFPRISEAKIKEGIFVGPQIRKVMQESTFEATLNAAEKAAWDPFKMITAKFLDIVKTENCVDIVKEMLDAFKMR